MTIDEIKQALREIKEHCKNRETCEGCPFAILQGLDDQRAKAAERLKKAREKKG